MQVIYPYPTLTAWATRVLVAYLDQGRFRKAWRTYLHDDRAVKLVARGLQIARTEWGDHQVGS